MPMERVGAGSVEGARMAQGWGRDVPWMGQVGAILAATLKVMILCGDWSNDML